MQATGGAGVEQHVVGELAALRAARRAPQHAGDPSAATPATNGVAIEVPLRSPKHGGVEQRELGSVLQIRTPGAARSTNLVPKFEKLASVSSPLLAATQITLSSS